MNVRDLGRALPVIRQYLRALRVAQAEHIAAEHRCWAVLWPVWDRFEFVRGDDISIKRGREGERIEHPDYLYASTDAELVTRYYTACSVALRAAGYTWDYEAIKDHEGYDPTWTTQRAIFEAEADLLAAVDAALGVVALARTHGDKRRDALNLIANAVHAKK